MRFKKLTTQVALVGAIVAPLATATPALATTNGAGAAYGLYASGVLDLPSVPTVESSSNSPDDHSLAKLPPLPINPLGISAKVLHVSAWADNARASVADLDVAELLLSARLITAKCENGAGSSKLVDVMLGSQKLPVTASPNTTLTVGLGTLGSVSVIINKQVRDTAGGLHVTALELGVTLAGITQTIDISRAACGTAVTSDPGSPGKTPTPAPSTTPSTPTTPSAPSTPTTPSTPTAPGLAPKPTPVTKDFPVTG